MLQRYETSNKLAETARLIKDARDTNRALSARLVKAEKQLKEATTKNSAGACPVRPEFVETIRKCLANNYETHNRFAMVDDLRRLVGYVDGITREEKKFTVVIRSLKNPPLIYAFSEPFLTEPVLTEPVLTEPTVPPRCGDVWENITTHCGEWVFDGRTLSGQFIAVCDKHKIDGYFTPYELRDGGDMKFLRRAKPKLGIRVERNDIILDRCGDVRTKYDQGALSRLVLGLMQVYRGMSITPVIVKTLQEAVDGWINDQIKSGGLFYDRVSDRWTTKS